MAYFRTKQSKDDYGNIIGYRVIRADGSGHRQVYKTLEEAEKVRNDLNEDM